MIRGEFVKGSPKEVAGFWWDDDQDDRAAALWSTLYAIDQNQDYRRAANLHHLRLYSNRLASGLSGRDYSLTDSGDRIKLNVIKSVVDAAKAQQATNRPRPMFLTTGGNYEQLTRAKRLNKFMAGQFYELDIYRTGLLVFGDSLIFGTGFFHVFSNGGRIKLERVFPDEIIVDDEEARDPNELRNLYRHREVSRQALLAIYKGQREKCEAIESAGMLRDEGRERGISVDMVSVVEGWHLPSSDDADDGLHVMAVDGCVLSEEPWRRDAFPVIPFRWSDPPLGFWGIGLAEELTSIQVEINFLAQKIQQLMNLATTQIWVRKGEATGSLDNRDMAVRTYKNTPPTALNVTPAHVQFFEQMDRLYQRAFEISGVSMSAATSQAPVGLKSGEAIKRHNEIGSRRFQHVGQNWESTILDVAEAILDEARDIEEEGGEGLTVLAQGDKDVEEIRFGDVSIEKNKYVMRVFPTSLLPDTPQGKIEAIQNLAQVSPEIQEQAVSLLTGIPDIEGAVDLANAPSELIKHVLEAIVERGEYEPPVPEMPLEKAARMTALYIQRAIKDGVDEDRIELLRRFADQCGEMLALANPPAPAPMPGPMDGMMPPGPPTAPPIGPAPAPNPAMMM